MDDSIRPACMPRDRLWDVLPADVIDRQTLSELTLGQ